MCCGVQYLFYVIIFKKIIKNIIKQGKKEKKQQTEDIYTLLNQQLENHVRSTMITGDFNAIIAKGNKVHPKLIGKFAKDTINDNDRYLIDFLTQNSSMQLICFLDINSLTSLIGKTHIFPSIVEIHIAIKLTTYWPMYHGRRTIMTQKQSQIIKRLVITNL